MLRWYPGQIQPLVPTDWADFLTIPVSWVVTIRATEPVLPPLRGNEIIVVPTLVLDELQAEDTAEWRDVVRLADEQGAAAILLDRRPENGLTPRAPLLVASPDFVAGAELLINREITERRSDLYRLGSALARVQTSAPGAGGLSAYLTATEVASGHPLMLVSETGATMGRSRSAPRRLPASVLESANLEGDDVEVLVSGPRADWLFRPVRSRGLGPGTALVIGQPRGAATESARLTLRQTAEAIRALYDQGAGPVSEPAVERAEFIRDLLLGRRPLDDPLVRLHLDSLRLTPPLRVAILSTAADGQEPGPAPVAKRGGLLTQIDGNPVLVVSSTEAGGLEALRGVAARAPGATLVISDAVADVVRLPAAYRRARAFSRLARAGAVAGPVIDLDDPFQSGVHGVLLELGVTASGAGERLARLVEVALRPLEQYDEDRHGELIHSLETYLDAGASLTAASLLLGVHRNTLSYRLNRIEELLGQDLADARVRFLLQFALAAHRARQAMED